MTVERVSSGLLPANGGPTHYLAKEQGAPPGHPAKYRTLLPPITLHNHCNKQLRLRRVLPIAMSPLRSSQMILPIYTIFMHTAF